MQAGPSGREGHVCSILQRSLPRVPRRNGFSFLPGESWKDELRNATLPRQSLSFIEREAQYAFVSFEAPAEFIQEGDFRLANLREEPAAGGDLSAAVFVQRSADPASRSRPKEELTQMNRMFHMARSCSGQATTAAGDPGFA
jgi:hypothetical protein